MPLSQICSPPACTRRLCASLSVMLVLSGLTANACFAGTWTQFTNANPGGGGGTMIQLTDGTVMIVADDSQAWTRLTPDSSGNYANGTWSNLAKMKTARLYFGSNVMPNGKLFVVGGEYSGSSLSQNITNKGEIFDPVANTWTSIPNFPKPEFGDDPTILLPNGKILCGYIFNASTYLFDPATNSWTTAGTKLRGDRSDEETWVMLRDGSVLSYDVFASVSNSQGSAQRYIPSTDTWVDAGTLPVLLSDSSVGFELGPATMLPDGRMLQVGANENLAIYNPTTNTWTAGPSLPSGMGADDAPGALLPNGHFVFLADHYLFHSPTHLFDFDYTTNALTDITSTLPNALQSDLASGASYFRRMIVMPNGHLMLGTGSSKFWDFAPSGAPQASWVPTITSVTNPSPQQFKLTGARLTGISQGSSYGDDVESDTNYPIIRLTGAGGVHFARTTNWTPGISTPGDTTLSTVDFTLPAGLAAGTYQLVVIASGMPSASVNFTIQSSANYVAANYSKSTNILSLSDDAGDNNVEVTLKNGKLTIAGKGNTLIGTAANSKATLIIQTGKSNVNLYAEFANGGMNTFTMTGVDSTNAKVFFGPGDDTLHLTLCHFGTLTADGKGGTNTLTLSGTKIKARHIKNFVGF